MLAEEAWGLDGTGKRGMNRNPQGRHGRGLGAFEGNPAGGWYGLKKGLRGRFGMYIPPLMEKLGLAELTHEPKGNKMRAR